MKKKYFIAEGASLYGDITLNEDVNVWFNAVIRADFNKVTIGKCSNVQDMCVIHVDKDYETVIGEYVTIGHSSIVHGAKIGDNVMIGMNSTILNGAIINNNSIVGAGSLVTQNKEFPSNSLIMGRPAKLVRELTDDEISHIRENAIEYVKNATKFENNEFKKII